VSSGSLTAIAFVILRFHGVHFCGRFVIYRTILTFLPLHGKCLLTFYKTVGGRQTLFKVVLFISLFWCAQLLYMEYCLVVIAHVVGIWHYFPINSTVALCWILSEVDLLVISSLKKCMLIFWV